MLETISYFLTCRILNYIYMPCFKGNIIKMFVIMRISKKLKMPEPFTNHQTKTTCFFIKTWLFKINGWTANYRGIRKPHTNFLPLLIINIF